MAERDQPFLVKLARLRAFCLQSAAILLAVCAFAAEAQPLDLSKAEWREEQLAPGLKFRQAQFDELFGGAQVVSLLAVEVNHPTTRVRFAAAQQFGKTRLTVPEIAEPAGAIAAINGGFFDDTPNANCGILKVDGKILPFTKREFGELRFVGSSAVGIDAQGHWHFMLRPKEIWENDWTDVQHALAGGHPLVLGGKIVLQIDREEYDPRREQRHAGGRNPRTAIGVTTNRVALLLTVDGRHAGRAEGITLRQLALLMQALGCENAINLDGGGSTTMWLRDRGIVNYPSDNRQFDHAGTRRVGTAVLVMADEPTPASQKPDADSSEDRNFTDAEIEQIWKGLWNAAPEPKTDLLRADEIQDLVGRWTGQFGVDRAAISLSLLANHAVKVEGEKAGAAWQREGTWKLVGGRLVLWIEGDAVPGFVFRATNQFFIFDPWAASMTSELARQR